MLMKRFAGWLAVLMLAVALLCGCAEAEEEPLWTMPDEISAGDFLEVNIPETDNADKYVIEIRYTQPDLLVELTETDSAGSIKIPTCNLPVGNMYQVFVRAELQDGTASDLGSRMLSVISPDPRVTMAFYADKTEMSVNDTLQISYQWIRPEEACFLVFSSSDGQYMDAPGLGGTLSCRFDKAGDYTIYANNVDPYNTSYAYFYPNQQQVSVHVTEAGAFSPPELICPEIVNADEDTVWEFQAPDNAAAYAGEIVYTLEISDIYSEAIVYSDDSSGNAFIVPAGILAAGGAYRAKLTVSGTEAAWGKGTSESFFTVETDEELWISLQANQETVLPGETFTLSLSVNAEDPNIWNAKMITVCTTGGKVRYTEELIRDHHDWYYNDYQADLYRTEYSSGQYRMILAVENYENNAATWRYSNPVTVTVAEAPALDTPRFHVELDQESGFLAVMLDETDERAEWIQAYCYDLMFREKFYSGIKTGDRIYLSPSHYSEGYPSGAGFRIQVVQGADGFSAGSAECVYVPFIEEEPEQEMHNQYDCFFYVSKTEVSVNEYVSIFVYSPSSWVGVTIGDRTYSKSGPPLQVVV